MDWVGEGRGMVEGGEGGSGDRVLGFSSSSGGTQWVPLCVRVRVIGAVGGCYIGISGEGTCSAMADVG